MILGFFILAGIANGITSRFAEKKPETKVNTVLDLNLNYAIPEQTQKGLSTGFALLSLDANKAIGLNDILASIHHAKDDVNIKGIYLHLGLNTNSYATLQEVRDALLEFKQSGKYILAYGEVINQSSYFLGSVADAVYLNPSGAIEFKGLSANLTFFKGTIDKLGVNTQIFYDGNFKSATEPFRYEKMSEENRLQLREFLNGLYDINLAQIATSRNSSIEQYKMIASQLSAWYPSLAVQSGLIDGLKYEDEVLDELKKKNGLNENDSLTRINLHKYSASFKKENPFDKTVKEKIAIVYADGSIIDGEGESGRIGSKTFTEMMREAEADETIKAVVLRVNSPGGSAVASDVMWRSIEEVKKSKPVIVSMGDYAASGGYMISCNADRIFAQQNTLTGSIGVFLIVPEISELMNEKLGITFDTVKTSPYADFPSITRPFSDFEKNILQAGVDSTYLNFKRMVAEGRHLTVEQVEEIAQGRIWLGTKAKELGLVDEIGGIDEAIKYAVQKAGMNEYSIIEFPKQEESIWQNIFFSMTEETKMKMLSENLGFLLPHLEFARQLLEKPVMQTRMPYDLEIN